MHFFIFVMQSRIGAYIVLHSQVVCSGLAAEFAGYASEAGERRCTISSAETFARRASMRGSPARRISPTPTRWVSVDAFEYCARCFEGSLCVA